MPQETIIAFTLFYNRLHVVFHRKQGTNVVNTCLYGDHNHYCAGQNSTHPSQ